MFPRKKTPSNVEMEKKIKKHHHNHSPSTSILLKRRKVEPQMMWKKAKSLTTKVSDHHIEREDHYSCAS